MSFTVFMMIIYFSFKAKGVGGFIHELFTCLLYTSDAADERSSVDLGGRRIIKKKNKVYLSAIGII